MINRLWAMDEFVWKSTWLKALLQQAHQNQPRRRQWRSILKAWLSWLLSDFVLTSVDLLHLIGGETWVPLSPVRDCIWAEWYRIVRTKSKHPFVRLLSNLFSAKVWLWTLQVCILVFAPLSLWYEVLERCKGTDSCVNYILRLKSNFIPPLVLCCQICK